jgi:ADP-ribosylglycohydrolase
VRTLTETIVVTEVTPMRLDRAKGCLFGQFIGDSLGSLVAHMPQNGFAKVASTNEISKLP